MAALGAILPAIASVASVGSSILTATGALGGKDKKPPTESSPEAQASRTKLLRARAAATGRQSTILAGRGANNDEPQVKRPTVLGGAQ